MKRREGVRQERKFREVRTGSNAFRRRCATRHSAAPEPWAEAHGYPRGIAPRCQHTQPFQSLSSGQPWVSLRNPVGIHRTDAIEASARALR
jgi:hypothetical protein